jgi:hypothetical protein
MAGPSHLIRVGSMNNCELVSKCVHTMEWKMRDALNGDRRLRKGGNEEGLAYPTGLGTGDARSTVQQGQA